MDSQTHFNLPSSFNLRAWWKHNYFEPARVTLQTDEPRETSSGRQKHCVLLHGWNSPGWFLREWKDALRELPQAAPWRFWLPDYPTHRFSFVRAASEVRRALLSQDANWDDVILIGYSMGGLVARQMARDGFPCRSLVTICSPHEGVLPWIPLPTIGPQSLWKSSTQLRNLNRDARDEKMRARSHFFAISYHDRLGNHHHDGLVPERSARGDHLGNVAQRETIHLEYGREIAPIIPVGPHVRGMNPQIMNPVLETCAQLFES